MLIYKGDDISVDCGNPFIVQLTKNSVPFSISSSATVTAAFKTGRGLTMDPVNVLESAVGSDWANSLIVIEMTSAQTAAIQLASGLARQVQSLEVTVYDGCYIKFVQPGITVSN